MRFVVVTGMSGSGKLTAIHFLEDMGYYCVDNLPVRLIDPFMQLVSAPGSDIDKVVLGLDVRADKSFDNVEQVLAALKKKGYKYEILFMDASDEVLIKRYKETRRAHPVCPTGRVEEGIAQERKILEQIKADADYVIDTSGLLTRILREYGEERCASRIASNIVKARSKKPLETTGELSAIVRASIPARMREKGGNPDKRTFQAIRIACNRELDVLRDSLDMMIDLLTPGGRLCVITFHSLEDRIVKNAFKRNENPCTCPPEFPVCVCGKKSKGRVVTRKAIAPTARELEVNRRSASAKLRVFEKG